MSTTLSRSGASLRFLAVLLVAPALPAQTSDPTSARREFLGEQFETNTRAREIPRVQHLGIHWEFDKTEGIAQGRRVADYVFDNAFRPLG